MSLNLKKLLEKAKFVFFRSKRYGGDTSRQPRANDGGSSSGPGNANDGDGSDDDEIDATSKSLMWWRDSLKHSCGEFSCVAIQANQEMESHCQVETGMNATFVGVYDGHCGPHAAMFIKDHLFQQLINMIRKHRTFSGDVLRGAIKATENGFIAHAETNVESNPLMAVSGSSCLVGVIWKGTLHIANVGDSCAVLCSEEHKTHTIIAEKLTTEHNVRNRTIRTELKLMYPNDANIVLKVNEIDGWRVKGISELSRSVGDIYLKRPDFTVPTSVPQKYRLPEPISEAVLTAEPTLFSRALTISDRFIIFASRAFWDLVSIDKAADIVWKNPRAGIARKLLKTALKDKNDVTFDDLEMLGMGSGHSFLDDITVIVIYLDHHLLGIKDITVPVASLKSFNDSEFRSIEELM